MRNVKLFMLVTLCMCLLQACHRMQDSDANEDTTNYAADTLKNKNIIVGKDDIKFVTDVAAAVNAEIKIGTLAKKQGQDKRIKNFGVMMVKDLNKGKLRLMALAKAKKIALSDSVTTADQKNIDALAKKTGKGFDLAYINQTAENHKHAADLFKTAAKTVYDPDIKAFAIRNGPTVKRHLDAIEAIQGSMK